MGVSQTSPCAGMTETGFVQQPRHGFALPRSAKRDAEACPGSDGGRGEARQTTYFTISNVAVAWVRSPLPASFLARTQTL